MYKNAIVVFFVFITVNAIYSDYLQYSKNKILQEQISILLEIQQANIKTSNYLLEQMYDIQGSLEEIQDN